MALSKNALDIICQALSQMSCQLAEIKRAGLTPAIKQIAGEDLKKVNDAWGEAEKEFMNAK